MNVFKKVFEDLKRRLHFDINFKDRSISLNVGLNPMGPKSFSIASYGLGNPVGGVLLCCLESNAEDPAGSHLSPKMASMSNVFMYLNGLLLPSNAPARTTLADFMKIKDATIEEKGCASEWEWVLDRGYALRCKYFSAVAFREFFMDPDLDDCSLSDRIADQFKSLLPADKTALFVDIVENIDSDDDCANSETYANCIMRAVARCIEPDWQTIMTSPEEDATSLASMIATYCYSNIISMVEERIHDITQSNEAKDIPWDNTGMRQTEWLAKVKKSVKNEESWKDIEDRFVIKWN